MANNAFRSPANTEVAQVKTFTITADSTSNTAVWTFTLTLDNGDTETVTYTEDGSPTTTEIATGLFNAWNASTKPHISQITATNPSAGVVVLTADTAGVPFSVALADSDDGTHTEADTTANVGNSDYGTARNWQLDAVPASTNDVLIDAAASGTSSVNIKYSLNQSSVAIADFRVFMGYAGQIGRWDNGVGYYLRIDPDLFRYEGSGQLGMFDIGSANIDTYINSSGTPVSNRYAVYLKGSNIANCNIVKGSVALAGLDADTATINTLNVSYVSNQTSDCNVLVGSGVTLTTLKQTGGTIDLRCAATTVTNGLGTTLTTQGSGAITTLYVYGTAYLGSTGTITNLHVYGTCDLSRVLLARTITNCTVYPGGTLILPKAGVVTLSNGMAQPAAGAVSSGDAVTRYK